MTPPEKNILIITGEPSGDMHAGELLKELRKLLPGFSFWGIGGDRMEEQGVELIEHVKRFSIVGVWEVLRNLSRIHAQYKDLTRNIRKRKPLLAILIDYPGFNLKVAAFLHREKIPVIYYIIPQVWAWGRGRIRALKRYVNEALVLFEFEKKFLQRYGIYAEFVGHPLVDKELPHMRTDASEEPFTIALLPGSRLIEIENMFPVMLETAEKIRRERKNTRFVIAENSNIDRALYDSILEKHRELDISRVTDDTFSVLARSDFALVTSGTATLEAAIMETPMIISYRASRLTAWVFFTFVRIPFLGLVNIIAGKEVAPELLQEKATPENMCRKVMEITGDRARMQKMKDELREVKYSLGEKGASRRAAEAIAKFTREQGLPA